MSEHKAQKWKDVLRGMTMCDYMNSYIGTAPNDGPFAPTDTRARFTGWDDHCRLNILNDGVLHRFVIKVEGEWGMTLGGEDLALSEMISSDEIVMRNLDDFFRVVEL